MILGPSTSFALPPPNRAGETAVDCDEIVPLAEAKERMKAAVGRLMAGDDGDGAQAEFDRWERFVANHPDHLAEQVRGAEHTERALLVSRARLVTKHVPPPGVMRRASL